VREACDRVVQIVMRNEEGEEEDIPNADMGDSGKLVELKNDDEDEDEQIVDIV
jgi:hypothetical protein